MPVEKAESNEKVAKSSKDDIHENLLNQAFELLGQNLSKQDDKNGAEQKLPPSLDHQCINNIEKFGRDAHKPGEFFACSEKMRPGDWSKPGDLNTPPEMVTCSDKMDLGSLKKPGDLNTPPEMVACSGKMDNPVLKKPGEIFACSAEIHKAPPEFNACSADIHKTPPEFNACSAQIKPGDPGRIGSEIKPRDIEKPGCKPHLPNDYACVARIPKEPEHRNPDDYACVARIPKEPEHGNPEDYACVARLPKCSIEDLK